MENIDILRNYESGKTGFVIGLGPSLRPFLSDLEQIQTTDPSQVTISCNAFDLMTKLDCKYWVTSNTDNTVANQYQRFNRKKNTTLVYADSIDLTPRDRVKSLLSGKYVSFDQRHIGGRPCPDPSKTHGCCRHTIPGRQTIQEYLQEISGYDKMCGGGDTVSLHMFSLAVILGCNPIFIIGVDLDYSSGYVDGSPGMNFSWESVKNNIINDFRTVYESAHKMGIESYVMDRNMPISKAIPYKEWKS